MILISVFITCIISICICIVGVLNVRRCVQVYEVVVMLSGSFDSSRVSVERRYSDFLRLQRLLLQEFDSTLEDVSPPPKLLSGNFCAAVLLQRRLALQDYLAKLFSTRCVRRSPLFAAFFTDAEQRGALVLLRGGQFSPALRQLEDVLALQVQRFISRLTRKV